MGLTGRAREAEAEEGGAALVRGERVRQPAARDGHGERRAARARAEHDVRQPAAAQLLDQHRRPEHVHVLRGARVRLVRVRVGVRVRVRFRVRVKG